MCDGPKSWLRKRSPTPCCTSDYLTPGPSPFWRGEFSRQRRRVERGGAERNGSSSVERSRVARRSICPAPTREVEPRRDSSHRRRAEEFRSALARWTPSQPAILPEPEAPLRVAQSDAM